MTKADCLPCRIGKTHTFHDSGDPNLAYAYEGTEPPIQDSTASCTRPGCSGNHDFEHDEVEKPCPEGACVLDNGHRGPHMNYRPGETLLLSPDEEPGQWTDERPLTEDEYPQLLMHQAEDLVYGDRQGAYGHPYDDYSRTAGMWSSFLGIEITPAQAALMMVLLKISRERNRPKDDNIVDAHGYLLCYGRIQGREDSD